MKILFANFFLLSLIALPAAADNTNVSSGAAQVHTSASGSNSGMKEDQDGVLEHGEYEVISTNGSITRALCPYTCEMRGLPKKICKTWQSKQDKTLCYVEDTSIPSHAIE